MRRPGKAINIIKGIINVLAGMVREFNKTVFGVMAGHATDIIKLEHDELENAFLTIVVGSLAGLPLAPIGLAIELAPLLKDEINIMFQRHAYAKDALAEYAGMAG